MVNLPRRDFVVGTGALAVAGAAGAAPAGAGRLDMSDGYFLSKENPVANRDQRDLEALAIKLSARPDMQSAKKRTFEQFAKVTSNTVSKEAWGMLPSYVDSFCFRSTLMGVNSDANYPKVLRVYSPAAKWLGNDVPASRWGAENPDNAFRIIPIAYGGRYVIRGQRQPNPSSQVSYTLVADTNTSVTVGLLESSDIDYAADGSFTITLDELPADGRRNHIRVASDALYLFIRDSMGDWAQAPDALRVERTNPPSRGPLSEDELAARSARIMQIGVAPAFYWQQVFMNKPMQTITKPDLTAASGGLVTQLSCGGWFRLAPDEAAVISLDPVKAAYRNCALYDVWGRTLDYRDHQTCLNDATFATDIDGRTTVVIAAKDPGVSNWLDSTGLREVTCSFRWQGIPAGEGKIPAVDTAVVKLARLDAALPRGIQGVTPAERAKQMETRRRVYDRRFIDS